MKRSIQISALVVFLFAFIVPQTALSEVELTLKNGRKIIADSCVEARGKLTCDKSDGMFRIDMKDVLGMKMITIKHRVPVQEVVPSDAASDQKTDEPKVVEPGKAGEKAAAKAPAGAPVGEQAKRLAEINARRTAYEAEREILMKEREQLREEVKAAGMMSSGRYQYYRQKLDDLDKKVKDFNDKVNKLNEETSAVYGGPAKEMP